MSPAEVEEVLYRLDGVTDVIVYGEPSAIVGNIVMATVNLSTDESASQFRKRINPFCRQHLQPYKVPQRIVVSPEPLHSGRFKRMRRGDPPSEQD